MKEIKFVLSLRASDLLTRETSSDHSFMSVIYAATIPNIIQCIRQIEMLVV
jgi:hypothetical protein